MRISKRYLTSLHDVGCPHGPRLRSGIEEAGPEIARRVLKALTALENVDDPTRRCKALSGPYTGLWRLRVGDYRVILDIQCAELVIIALDLGNRSNVYE